MGLHVTLLLLLLWWESQKVRDHWVDNIKMDLREIGWDVMNWTYLARDRDREGSCEHDNEPSGSIKCWEVLE
jgi:hypothetical protein